MVSRASVSTAAAVPAARKLVKLAKLATSVASCAIRRERPATLAETLKTDMENAGTLFIKIGQWVSARTDVFPSDITKELAELRVNVSPLHLDVAERILREDGLWDLFGSFESAPVSCGSIAQVHRATLADGRVVAVKIQRPDLEAEFDDDLDVVRLLMRPYKLWNRKAFDDVASSLTDLYAAVRRELDFKKEVQHMRAFRKFLKERAIDWVCIPKPLPSMCTDRVIVMEYVDSSPVSGSDAAEKLLEFFYLQFFEIGLLHTDLHSGNLGRDADGRLVVYDFGSVMRIPAKTQRCFKKLIAQYLRRDPDRMLDAMLEHGVLAFDGTASELGDDQRAQLRQFVETIITYIEETKIDDFQESMRRIDVSTGMPVTFAPEVTMVFRSFSLLEGLCKEIDPSFVILDRLVASNLVSFFLEDPAYYILKLEDDLRTMLEFW